MPEIYIALQALQLLWLVGLTLSTAVRRPGEEAIRTARLAGEAAEAIKGRVDVLEERLKHMPTGEDHNDLSGRVMAIQATLLSVQATQTAAGTTLSRIEHYLLTSK